MASAGIFLFLLLVTFAVMVWSLSGYLRKRESIYQILTMLPNTWTTAVRLSDGEKYP